MDSNNSEFKQAVDNPNTTASKLVHLVGIGGIGMSALAQVLHAKKYIVQGSDRQQNSLTALLSSLGVKIFQGHDAAHVTSTDIHMVVVSSSIRNTNPELRRAKELNIPVLTRGEMLARLMEGSQSIVITGTHGKTTVTSLIGHILNCMTPKQNLTIINGGIMRNCGSNVLIQSAFTADPIETEYWNNSRAQKQKYRLKEWFVVEGDESDGTMLLLPRRIAVIVNIDLDHMNYYKTEENLMRAFQQFVEDTLEGGGSVVLCTDCPRARQIYEKLLEAGRSGRLHQVQGQNRDSQVITYGLHEGPAGQLAFTHVQGWNSSQDVHGMHVDIRILGVGSSHFRWENVFVPLYGSHNIQNALAAAAVATHFEVTEDDFRKAMVSFLGTKRRFTVTGEVQGIMIIDDYAHHPAEIAATLIAARNLISSRQTDGRLVVVHQVHQYYRLQQSYEEFVRCFEAADLAILPPVYALGEEPIPGVSLDTLARDVNINAKSFYQTPKVSDSDSSGGPFARAVSSFDEVNRVLLEYCKSGDIIVCCGAGSITELAHQLPNALRLKLNNTYLTC